MLCSLNALWRSRDFVALSVAVVALTVGGATSLLQTVDAAFLKPLPFPQADRMVVVLPFSVAEGKRFGRLPSEFVEALDGLIDAPTSVWAERVTAYAIPDRPQIWEGVMASRNAVRLFGLEPIAGRLLNDIDFDAEEGPLPTMIEEGLWRRAFGGRAESLGRVVKGDRQDLHIVGAYRAGLVLPAFSKVVAPVFIAPDRNVTPEWMLGPIGRLRPGVSGEEAARTMAARVAAVHADNAPLIEIVATLATALTLSSAAAVAAQGPGTRPIGASPALTVVIVIDDTQVRAGDGTHIADLVDTLERDLGSPGAVGVMTVGPAGLNIDLTKDRQRLREVSEAARASRLEFKGAANPEMAAGARLASMEGVIVGLATRPGPKAIVFVGRASPVADAQRPSWGALRRHADSARLPVAWLDLGVGACGSAALSDTDVALVAETRLCAPLSNNARTTGVILALRRRPTPQGESRPTRWGSNAYDA